MPGWFWQNWGMQQSKTTAEKRWLAHIRVRLIQEEEPARFDELLEQEHDLHVPGSVEKPFW